MTIGQKLAQLRKRCGYTQDDVAVKLGISAQAVSKWENDVSCPDITLLPKIAALYETTVDDLLSPDLTPEAVVVKEEHRKNIDDMILKVRISDKSDKVNINLPIPLVKATLALGMSSGMNINGKVDLSGIDFSMLIKMVENGAMGKLVEIESSDGGTVTVEVV